MPSVYRKTIHMKYQRISEYNQDMPRTQTTDQPMVPRERGTERQQKPDIQNTAKVKQPDIFLFIPHVADSAKVERTQSTA